MKPEALIIAGYYGFGNAGDELILYSLIQRYRHLNPGVSIAVLSQAPSETHGRFDVQALDRWKPWTWIKPLVVADRFILGGGGLLQEATGPWNHAYYLSLLVFAKCFGCRTEIVAIGVDPIARWQNRFWTRFVLNHWVDTISVRDKASLKALSDAGVTSPIDIEKDPVFDLSVIPERLCRGSMDSPPVTAGNDRQKRIAFAISPSKTHPRWSRGIAELCDLIAKRLDVSVDLLVFFPKEDEKFAYEIVQYAAFEPHVRMWENPLDLLGWIPEYDLVVATRFHALVLAATSKTPFIGWGNQAKVAFLCEKSGSLYINTEAKWDVDDQVNRISSLYKSSKKTVTLSPL